MAEIAACSTPLLPLAGTFFMCYRPYQSNVTQGNGPAKRGAVLVYRETAKAHHHPIFSSGSAGTQAIEAR